MRLPYPKDFGTSEEHFKEDREYFNPSPSAPQWYHGELMGPGRRYEIQPEGYYYPGEVIFNEESNTVFVYLIFS
jgi:hypothetical protein